MAMVRKARRDEAHWYPSFWYIWLPKRGNAAAKVGQPKSAKPRSSLLTCECTAHKGVCGQGTGCILWICVNLVEFVNIVRQVPPAKVPSLRRA